MDMMIFFKWATVYPQPNHDDGKPNAYPSIITTMTNIVLKVGDPHQQAIVGTWDQQKAISLVFIVCAVISVPVMLFVKPKYLHHLNIKESLRRGSHMHKVVGMPMRDSDIQHQPLADHGSRGYRADSSNKHPTDLDLVEML